MCVWYLDKLNLIRLKPNFSTAPAVASKNKTEFKIRQKLLENNQLHLLVLIHGTFCIYVKIHTIYFFSPNPFAIDKNTYFPQFAAILILN